MPHSVRFFSGEYQGLVFHRGTGPTKRVQDQDGKVRLINSTNFWYSPISVVSVSAEYLRANRGQWTEARSL